MAVNGKIGALCQAFLLAASMTAISAGAAQAQQANDLNDLAQRVLDNPQDVDLNLQYAHAAEAAGKPRIALATYERILLNDPSNAAARNGYERVRRQIEPGYTVTRLEVGARWDSNPENLPENFFFNTDQEAVTYFGKLMIANESRFLGARWRSIVNATVESNSEFDELDYDYVGAQTGPIIAVGPHLAAIPAIGGGVAWLGGDEYFKEANVGVTLEGRGFGTSFWARLRGGYRDYNPDPDDFFSPVTESGNYIELQGGITKPRLFSEHDVVTVEPFVRMSDIDGDVFDYWIFDELSPGKYTEYGVDVNYNYQLTDHLQASVGALLRQRDFTDSSREDTYLSPQIGLTLQRALPCDCDVRLQYRHRDNDSNDYSAAYDANQVSLSLTTRF